MNSTHVTVSRLTQWLLLCVVALLGARTSIAADSPMPRPPELERDVQFWIRVYTEATTNGGFMHDESNLGVVYSSVKFAPNTPPKERQRLIDDERDKYSAALRRIATSSGPLSEDDQRIKDMWGDEGTTSRLLDATNHIRFQLGQADRFKEGLLRSGAWQAHIAETLANLGLPPELAVLPHVESSFNPAAYSKVGAAGLWQFMRSTGRRYMRIDNTVDDRMDPFRATEAAAQLLSYNYRLLGTWPLALTAYNHGAAGMRRAKDSLGTDDIVKILRTYKSPSFGFASRNFYVSFLAALEIDRNPEKYFGTAIERQPEAKFQEIEMPAYVPIAALERVLRIDRERLRMLNPALLPSVWRGQNHVPRGYRLRLPASDDMWTTAMLAQRLNPRELLAGQPVPARHRVRKGDTLATVARQYGVSTRELASLNGMKTTAKLRAGRYVRIPESQIPVAPTLVATTTAPPPAKAISTMATTTTSEPQPKIYVVHSGESISEIASKVNVPEAQLLKINKIKNPNFLFEGQRLLLAASDLPADEAAEAAVPQAPPPPVQAAVASAQPAPGGVTADVAERESEEDAAAVAKVAKPTEKAEPVSAAQAEAQGPALGPAVEAAETADPIDYSVAKDGSIRVAAAETLGHYADWLGVSAGSLRKLNNMKYGKPVLIGRKLKLNFDKTSRDSFEDKRRDYHRTLQAQYFAAHRILGTEVYIARRGDSLWTVTQRYARLPVWLLQQYNPDTDFSEMRAGTQIVVPRVEEVVAAVGNNGNDT
jgi:membrane-bound lytic murein transglycosylase D